MSLIDGGANNIIATVTVGGDPLSIAVNPTTDLVYTESTPARAVFVIGNGGTTTSTTSTTSTTTTPPPKGLSWPIVEIGVDLPPQ